jgi:hypothetical protein
VKDEVLFQKKVYLCKIILNHQQIYEHTDFQRDTGFEAADFA